MNKDRLAVAIGKNGITKKKIQYLTNTIIEIDSKREIIHYIHKKTLK